MVASNEQVGGDVTGVAMLVSKGANTFIHTFLAFSVHLSLEFEGGRITTSLTGRLILIIVGRPRFPTPADIGSTEIM